MDDKTITKFEQDMKIDFFKVHTDAVKNAHSKIIVSNVLSIIFVIVSIIYWIIYPSAWHAWVSLLLLFFLANREKNIAIVIMAGVVTNVSNFIKVLNDGLNEAVFDERKNEEE